MKHRKKVEIVTDSAEIETVIELLDEIGVSGYTVIRDVIGKGGRGKRTGDEITDLLKNSYIMVICNDIEAHRIIEAITPIRKRFGGIFIVSDVVIITDNPPDNR
ncbi:MAG: transcriptional regulator [Planctomycetes bacterium]|nr:transcriptional regulator [Planctomycetota bacterium]